MQCATPSALKSHALTHTGEKLYDCPVENCNSSFARQSSLDAHMRTHFPDPGPRTVCPQCNDAFSCQQAVVNHLRSVHNIGDQPMISCSFEGCSYQHWRQSKVSQHETTHSTEKLHKCPYERCEKSYRRPGHLKEHINAAHTREHVFTCDKCPYATPWKQSFDEHVRHGHNPVTGEVIRNWRETQSLELLSEMLPSEVVEHGVRIDCDNTTRPYIRVDGVIKKENVMFVFEVDEGQHKDATKYTVPDEILRMRAASQVILRTFSNVCWIRLNPDFFVLDGAHPVVTLRTRVQTSAQFIQSYVPQDELAVVYLFYDEVNGRPTLLEDSEYDASFKEHVIPFSSRPILYHEPAAVSQNVTSASVRSSAFFERVNESDNEDHRDRVRVLPIVPPPSSVASTLPARLPHAPAARQTCNTTCEECHKTFFDRSTYLKHNKHVHERQQRASGSFICSYEGCGKVYTQSHNLSRHIARDHNNVEWICDICGVAQSSKSNLATHNKIKHGGDEAPLLKCQFCSFTTSYTQSMAKHVRRHHPEGGASV